MWNYKGKEINSVEDVPEGAVGFVYLLTNVRTGKKYIGKKSIRSNRKKVLTKKEIAALENKRRKKWKIETKESDWLTYMSSSKEIKEEVEAGEVFSKEILEFTYSAMETTYLEVKLQFVNEVLESDDWYNGNISSKWFKGNIGERGRKKTD